MTGNHSHASADPVSLLATPVVDPAPDFLGSVRGVYAGRGGDGVVVADADLTDSAVVTPADVSRTRIWALSARIDQLESQLERAERRRLATIDRYEYLLERRTETFRLWVAEDDPRPSAFEWIGRDVDVGDRVEGPTPGSGAGAAVATDGGHVRSGPTGDEGILARFAGAVRSLLSR